MSGSGKFFYPGAGVVVDGIGGSGSSAETSR